MDTAHEGAAIAPFSVQLFFLYFFSYARGVLETNLFTVIVMTWFGFPVNFNAQGAFLITFLICNNLLNYLRSISTIVITTMAKTASASFDYETPHWKQSFCAVLMYSPHGLHRKFNFKQKYQHYGPRYQAIFPFLITIFKSYFKKYYHNMR